MNKTEFGSYIKESRLKKNYTQKQLADLLFIDVSAVSKWERGISFPDITLVPDICKVLDISEHELISASSDHEYRRMKKDAKIFNNMKKGTFWTFNICYAIALLVCFIVNISVDKTLSWFFIVAASILCSYSFCPTFTWVSKKFRLSIFISSTFVSLFLLYLTCSIYTSNYWFMIATLGTLIGYFLLFFPFLLKLQKEYLPLDKYNKLLRYFPIIYFVVTYILISLLLIAINTYNPFNLSFGLLLTNILFILPVTYGILNIYDVTRKFRKPFIIVVGSLCSIVILFALGSSIYQVNTKEINTYMVEESFTGIKFNADSDIQIYKSNETKIVAKEYEDIKVEFDIVDNTLVLDINDTRGIDKWLFNITTPYIKLYLENDTFESLNIKGNTNDVKIDGEFNFNTSKIIVNTGDITIKDSYMGDSYIKSDTGDINIYSCNFKTLETRVNTGDVLLSNTLVENDYNHKGDTGDVVFKGFDAANIYITLDTGDVRGTLLSNKIFIVKSNTGDEKVPETTTGGICKITADTGDIIITIKE